eukprot:TRINITY_DN12813_c0_g1_i1.p1 TRINITY_DN12813_c0_g1~~TRINITY_DN12813_c0_g1_i1.p1  ORF type:complete len:180 (-),score=25.21 TRINITY_DN12813_c0_g1_i1:96-578(-)
MCIRDSFYNDYKESSFYWEFLKIFQKVILISLVVTFENNYQNKTLTMIIFLAMYYLLVSKVKPFTNLSFTEIDRRVTVIYVSTLFLTFYVKNNDVVWLRIPAEISIWVMNLAFIISLAYLLIKTYKQLFGEKIYAVLTTVGRTIYNVFKGSSEPNSKVLE